jgi:hypothetical protein
LSCVVRGLALVLAGIMSGERRLIPLHVLPVRGLGRCHSLSPYSIGLSCITLRRDELRPALGERLADEGHIETASLGKEEIGNVAQASSHCRNYCDTYLTVQFHESCGDEVHGILGAFPKIVECLALNACRALDGVREVLRALVEGAADPVESVRLAWSRLRSNFPYLHEKAPKHRAAVLNSFPEGVELGDGGPFLLIVALVYRTP